MPAIPIAQALALAEQHLAMSQWAQAQTWLEQILAVDPRHAGALHALALVARARGAPDTALELMRRAVALAPQVAQYRGNLGVLLKSRGEFGAAIAEYRHALRLDPHLVEAHNNLGAALSQVGQLDEAIAAAEEAIRLCPAYRNAHFTLGAALRGARRFGDAAAVFRAMASEGGDAAAHSELGVTLAAAGSFGAALDALTRATQLAPELATIHNNFATALLGQGRLDEALSAFRRAMELQPDAILFHGNYLIALHYHPATTVAALREAHAEYDRRHTAALRSAWRRHENSPSPNRQLRLGFISPHFENYPVARFLLRPLEHLERSEFHVTCYSDTRRCDADTARFRATANAWHEVVALSDETLAERVRGDSIDILFDLAGHTSGHRLGVFARKPAPVQITWLDYVGTTGLGAMDYILGDPREIPADAEAGYCERVLRMPHDYICYDPPGDAPPVNPLPALERGHITFGSFNILPKTTAEIVAVWAQLLARLPTARLIVMNRGFDDPPTAERYRGLFRAHGIDAARVEFRGWCPPERVLAAYHEIDLALDTWPYHGGLTTCEALWMGVPVITCPGETFCSRHGLTHLTAAGWTAGIARDLEEYIEVAAEWACDLPRLAELRQSLRACVAASPLCDGRQFASDLAAILRGVWREWVASRAD